MTAPRYQSWGRTSRRDRAAVVLGSGAAGWPVASPSCLPYGNGRSYGDSCLNDQGLLLDCRGMGHILSFDGDSGVLQVEAGVLLSSIIDHVLQMGWFLPVTPGTKYVTVGGAIANDVHGKNHHHRGTFGSHVRSLELMRSDGSRQRCSARSNPLLFSATIGGMGLTGVITTAELQLMPVASAGVDQEVIRFDGLADFFRLARESDAGSEYSVAWIDQLARGRSLGRGLLIRGNHAHEGGLQAVRSGRSRLAVPFELPFSVLNRSSIRAFNALHLRKEGSRHSRRRVALDPFFYPLDGIADWNRLYGPNGLHQHQSVVPLGVAQAAITEMLERTHAAGLASFLTVLKVFGDRPSPGLLSFPRPGATLTLDFPNTGPGVLRLLEELDRVTLVAGGAVNPYKDVRMGAQVFEASFPRWREILPYRDEQLVSDFWRRVTGA